MPVKTPIGRVVGEARLQKPTAQNTNNGFQFYKSIKIVVRKSY
ncbi:MAG: hypothetical protein ABIO55_05445 [Ginsengibacter sp.]